MFDGRLRGIAAALALAALSAASTANAKDEAADGRPAGRQYTYAWPYTLDGEMRPRGGSTRGPAVTLAPGPSKDWQALTAPDLTKFERDRRAILAMAGPYRTSFDFLETVGFTPAYEADRPYQSWATEYVYVAADENTYISLQHIIVMFFKQSDDTLAGPMVVKHWRQDWRYEDRDLHVYAGHGRWKRARLGEEQARGTWTQAVYQVDDSPRYESYGTWEHLGNYSSWAGSRTWRPLPRREFSVRSDYQVLDGTNRHTITPTGWVHEEDNLKLVLDSDGHPAGTRPVLAREAGLNRYERITGHDFGGGDAYWEKTAAFWREVRLAWQRVYTRRDEFRLRSSVDGEKLFEVMFDYANRFVHGEAYDAGAARTFVDETLAAYLD